MDQSSKKREQFYLNRKLVAIVIALLIIGSGLVVLTNTAINLITASRDYTALVATWSQANSEKFQQLTEYTQLGTAEDRRQFIQAQKREHEIRYLINSLFEKNAETKKMFDGFEGIEFEQTEVKNLITAFQLFRNLSNFEMLQKTWSELSSINIKADELASSRQLQSSQQITDASKMELLQTINAQEEKTSILTTQLLNDVGSISEWINGFALWIAVILGLLLVLAAIVFSVRGWKSIKKWEEILKERNYLASFPELNPNPVLQVNRDGSLNYLNQATRSHFPDIESAKFDHPLLQKVGSIFRNGELSNDAKYKQVVRSNGNHYMQNIHYIKSEDGFHIHAQDMTEKIKRDEQIRQSLKEKEVLLSEIHHRVKNNLAVISGLLEIQSMNNANPEKALKESQARIQSMAMIHEILYEADSFSEIKFKDYIHRLIDKIYQTYLPDNELISVNTRIADVDLNINQAIPCGLILNELLSNAIEHAFIEDQEGQITVIFSQKEEHIQLVVKDNGKGLPEGFSLSITQSTGFTIIQALTTQLEAELTINQTPGTEFIIQFQKSDSSGSGNAQL